MNYSNLASEIVENLDISQHGTHARKHEINTIHCITMVTNYVTHTLKSSGHATRGVQDSDTTLFVDQLMARKLAIIKAKQWGPSLWISTFPVQRYTVG